MSTNAWQLVKSCLYLTLFLFLLIIFSKVTQIEQNDVELTKLATVDFTLEDYSSVFGAVLQKYETPNFTKTIILSSEINIGLTNNKNDKNISCCFNDNMTTM